MQGIAIMLAVTLTAVPASAQLRPKPATATTHVVVLPVGSCISSPFGPRILPNHPQAGTYHNGVDLPAPDGPNVLRRPAPAACYPLLHGYRSDMKRMKPALAPSATFVL